MVLTAMIFFFTFYEVHDINVDGSIKNVIMC